MSLNKHLLKALDHGDVWSTDSFSSVRMVEMGQAFMEAAWGSLSDNKWKEELDLRIESSQIFCNWFPRKLPFSINVNLTKNMENLYLKHHKVKESL